MRRSNEERLFVRKGENMKLVAKRLATSFNIAAVVMAAMVLGASAAQAGTPFEIHLTVDPSFPEDVHVKVTNLSAGGTVVDSVWVDHSTNVWSGGFDWVAEWTDNGNCGTKCAPAAVSNLLVNTRYKIEITPLGAATKTYTFNACPTYESQNQMGIRCPQIIWSAPNHVNAGDFYAEVFWDGSIKTTSDAHRAQGYFEDLQPNNEWVIPHDFRASNGATYGYFMHLGPEEGSKQEYSTYWGWPGARVQLSSSWYVMGEWYVVDEEDLHDSAARFCDEKGKRPLSISTRVDSGGYFLRWQTNYWQYQSSFPRTYIDTMYCFTPTP